MREVAPSSMGFLVSSEGALLATLITHATATIPAMTTPVNTSPRARKMIRCGPPLLRRLRRWRSRRDMREVSEGRSGFAALPPTPCLAQYPQRRRAQSALALDALGRRHRRAGDLYANARVRHLRDAGGARVLDVGELGQGGALVGVGRQPDRHLERDDSRADRVVAQHPGREALVGDDQARIGAGAKPCVGQGHVLDSPGLALE